MVAKKNAIKVATIFIVSFFFSTTFWDMFIFEVCRECSNEVSNFAALILSLPSFDLVDWVISIGFVGLFIIGMVQLLQAIRPDIHLKNGVLSRWVLFGILLGLSEFNDIFDLPSFNMLFSCMMAISYWLLFYKYSP